MKQLKISQQITSRESIALIKYLNEVSTLQQVDAEEETALAVAAKEGNQEAFQKLITANLRFVISVAKQYLGSKARLEDLVAAGNEGMIKAVLKYDTSRGFKFISYAVWWIRQSIMEYLNDYGHKGFRLPANKVTIIFTLKKTIGSLEQQLYRIPTSEEIANKFNQDTINSSKKREVITPDDVQALLLMDVPLSSLDMKIGEDQEISLMDLLQAGDEYSADDFLKKEDLQFVLKNIIDKKLTPKEKSVITSFFGLFGEPRAKLLEEIGSEHNLTRERVRQIKEKALKKIRSSSSLNLIQQFI